MFFLVIVNCLKPDMPLLTQPAVWMGATLSLFCATGKIPTVSETEFFFCKFFFVILSMQIIHLNQSINMVYWVVIVISLTPLVEAGEKLLQPYYNKYTKCYIVRFFL